MTKIDTDYSYEPLDSGGDWAEIERQEQEDNRLNEGWLRRNGKRIQLLKESGYVDEIAKTHQIAQIYLQSDSTTQNEKRQAETIDNLNKRLASLENSNLLLRKENSELKTNVKNINPLDNPYKPAGGFVQVGKWFVHECLTKQVGLRTLGLKNADLGILFRILPLIGFNHNILHNPMSQIPFNTKKEIADYLGENQSTFRGSLSRIEKAGIIIPTNGVFVANEDYLICGQISQRTRDAREKHIITNRVPRNKKRRFFRDGSPEHKSLTEEKERRAGVVIGTG